MPTSSTISVVLKDNSVRTVNCAYDGYLMGVGRTLLLWYNSQSLAEKLTAMGNICVLGSKIGKRISEFSHRDNKEELCIKEYKNLDEYLNHNDEQRFNYVYSNGWNIVKGVDTEKHLCGIQFNVYGTKVLENEI